jgi:hypothetical protein
VVHAGLIQLAHQWKATLPAQPANYQNSVNNNLSTVLVRDTSTLDAMVEATTEELSGLVIMVVPLALLIHILLKMDHARLKKENTM